MTVAICMGSESDLAVMRAAAAELDELGVVHEVHVLSAHRTPRRMLEFASAAAERGYRVLIAGAGGAAHLPGMLAASTILPVVGVPIPTTSLGGMDALLSIVQMPGGVPVATVAIGQARNAAILAAQILALADPELAKRLTERRARVADEVAEGSARVHAAFSAASASLARK